MKNALRIVLLIILIFFATKVLTSDSNSEDSKTTIADE